MHRSEPVLELFRGSEPQVSSFENLPGVDAVSLSSSEGEEAEARRREKRPLDEGETSAAKRQDVGGSAAQTLAQLETLTAPLLPDMSRVAAAVHDTARDFPFCPDWARQAVSQMMQATVLVCQGELHLAQQAEGGSWREKCLAVEARLKEIEAAKEELEQSLAEAKKNVADCYKQNEEAVAAMSAADAKATSLASELERAKADADQLSLKLVNASSHASLWAKRACSAVSTFLSSKGYQYLPRDRAGSAAGLVGAGEDRRRQR